MPRDYQRKLGARDYKNYDEDQLNAALTKIVTGSLTIRAASREYKIPYGTLFNKYNGKFIRTPGAQTIFTNAEEKSLLKGAAKCSDWGYPLTTLDLRFLAKAYLDKQGRNVPKFTNNLPGSDWAYSLLKRHKDEYSKRVAANIKRARAMISKEKINTYFDHLEPLVKDLPPSNIFNYDESNLSDDPGKKQGIYRRGVKYPEKVTNYSKSATSVMICGSADGVMLPPYVIYKSLHLYDTWKEGAPCGSPCCTKRCCSNGTRFNRTTSGWFDSVTFRDWFITCFLPHAKNLPGRKVMIGDNLSSHLDIDVVRICSENEIDFVCLVPHSTHLCQPLDVAFFRPMKAAWRATLTEWKARNMKITTVPKDTFPRLLTSALQKMDSVQAKPNAPFCHESSGIKRNMRSAFQATGIFPYNREQVFKRLPEKDANTNADEEVESVLTDYLREKRFGGSSSASTTRKRTRLNIIPGASVSTTGTERSEVPPNTREENRQSDSEEEEMETTGAGPSTSAELHNDTCTKSDAQLEKTVADSVHVEGNDDEKLCVGQYVLAKFFTARGKKTYKYVCRITEISPCIVVVGYKSVGNKKIFMLVRDDISDIERHDIIAYLPEPKSVNSKGSTNNVEFPFEVDILEL